MENCSGMLNSGPIRVLLGAAVGMAIGFAYYCPELNPILMQIWQKEYLNGKVPSDMTIPMMATTFSLLILAACINQYVNYRQIPTGRLFRMALEIWIMSFFLRAPHVLWASQSVKGFAVDQLYDFLIIVGISFAVGFNRFNGANCMTKFKSN